MATFIVTTLADENDIGASVGNPGGTGLSLREALALANTTANADSITFAAALAGQTLTLTQGELTITGDVTISGDVNGDYKADITISANHASRAFDIDGGNPATRITAELDALVIADGNAADSGGGIFVGQNDALTLSNSTLADNSAQQGGAVFGHYQASIAITASTLSGNSATRSGGAIYLNSFSNGFGASATLTDTTLSGNHADAHGGAIYGYRGNAITLINSTVTGNSAGAEGGGVYNLGAHAVTTLTNTIVAGNAASNGADLAGGRASTDPRDFAGLVLTGGNIVGSDPFHFAQVTGTATTIDGASEAGLGTVFAAVAANPHTGALAGVLADNGGSVATVALAASAANPALDAGDGSLIGVPVTDARGLGRVDVPNIAANGNNTPDIGAFELQGPFETPSLVVTTLADVVDPFDNQTSLREAVAYANANLGADTITFASNLAGGTLTLTQGQLTITCDVAISGDVDGDHRADITISANHASRVFDIDDANPSARITATLDGLNITGGSVSDQGGGIFVGWNDALNLSNSTLSDNGAGEGGAIFGHYQASIAITASTLNGNSAIASGGGIYLNALSSGFAASATLTDATLSGNHAGKEGGGIYGYRGNAITLTNSTVTGNSATEGGGIYNFGAGAVTTLTNTIVAGNAASDGADLAGGRSISDPSNFASLVLSGGNIVGSDPFHFAQVTGTATTIDGASEAGLGSVFAAVAADPHTGVLSGVLADNGGAVATVALKAASNNPALDAGDDGLTGVPATDARGLDRVDVPTVAHNASNISDLGAYELQPGAFEAPSLVVTTADDVIDPLDGKTSLREALALANSTPGADTITFDPSLAGHTLTLTQGELAVTTDVTIDGDVDHNGSADITIDGNNASRIFSVDDGAYTTITAALNGLVIRDGNAGSEYGGAIRVGDYDGLRLTNSTLSDNAADGAGAIYAHGHSTISITRSTIAGNTAAHGGGGIYAHAYSAVTLTNSTLSHNTALASNGGGIYADLFTAVTLINSTVSGNSAGENGGGIYGFLFNAITLHNSTVTGNHAGGHGGGIYNDGEYGVTTLTNSIVAGNTGSDSNDLFGGDNSNLMLSGGNIIGSAPVLFGSVSGTATTIDGTSASALATVFGTVGNDPNTGVLSGLSADNGGPVQTVLIRSGGIAQDSGDAGQLPPDTQDLDHDGNSTEALPADARGLSRVVGALDLGAVELQDIAPVNTTATTAAVAENQTFVTALSATDVDGPSGPTFTISGGADSALFDIVGGNLVFRTARDYETDAHVYQVEVTASDGLLGDPTTITVDLTDVNDNAPVFTSNANAPLIVPENSAAVAYAAAASDADIGTSNNTIAYSLSGDDAALFAVDPASGEVRFLASPDFEAPKDQGHDNNYHVTVHANDGVHDVTQDVTISVSNVNEAPTAHDGSASGEQVITGQLVATDVDSASLHYLVVTAPQHGAVTAQADGTFSYTAATGYTGTDSFTFKAADGQLDSNIATVNLNVTLLHLTGTPGNDTFAAQAGDERIDALGGTDTISFDFKLTDAHISWLGNEVIVDGPSGSHTVLTGFEVYQFTDGTVHDDDADPLVDDLFYYSQNHDVWTAHADADLHYHQTGWHENRDPNAFFSTRTYLAANADVKAAGVDPLIHFDQTGWSQARLISLDFDTQAYLAANPDVAAAHVDPLRHFLQTGAGEGRQPIAPSQFLAANGFDYVYYLQHNPDVAAAGVDPYLHFETVGWKEGRNPNALFDTNGYLATYADVKAAGVNPLDHYHETGWLEGRDPSVNFDTTSYLATYHDVAAAHVDPLLHFLQTGIHEGRSPFADGVWG